MYLHIARSNEPKRSGVIHLWAIPFYHWWDSPLGLYLNIGGNAFVLMACDLVDLKCLVNRKCVLVHIAYIYSLHTKGVCEAGAPVADSGNVFIRHFEVENAYNAIIRHGADAFNGDNNHFATALWSNRPLDNLYIEH